MIRIRVAGCLWALGVVALWLAMPRPLDLAGFGAGAVLCAVFVYLGLATAGSLGKGAPLLERYVQGAGPTRGEGRMMALACLAGAVMGAIVLVVLVYGLVPLEPALGTRLRARQGAPLWLPIALAVESSVHEELFFRLFLMSVVAWALARGWRPRAARGEAGAGVAWAAALVSALAFAAAHLPSWQAAPQGVLLVGSVLALNGAAGIALGRVFWKWGIEAAIIFHFAADVVVQTLGPRLLG